MPAFTKIIVLYNFRHKKLSKPCTQLYKQPVPYLPVNASMDNTIYSKSGVEPNFNPFLFIFKCRFGRDFGRALWGVGSGLSFLIILGGANGVGCKDVV